MPPTSFTLRFECGHTFEIPPLHSAGHVNCFVCQPELLKKPLPGNCEECQRKEPKPEREPGEEG